MKKCIDCKRILPEKMFSRFSIHKDIFEKGFAYCNDCANNYEIFNKKKLKKSSGTIDESGYYVR